MNASEQDFGIYELYRSARRRGDDEERALAWVAGRDQSATAVREAIGRVEAELLALPGAEKARRTFVTLGFSESAARAEAIDSAWSRLEEARSSAPTSTSSLSAFERESLAGLTEAWRRRWAEGDEQLRSSLRDEWGFDGTRFVDERHAIDLAESKLGRRKLGGSPVKPRPKPSGASPRPPVVVETELREVGHGEPNLEEAFRRMGLSDDAARDAAKGR